MLRSDRDGLECDGKGGWGGKSVLITQNNLIFFVYFNLLISASPPRLEEMDTDVLPDYEEDADNDDCRGDTAKKARFSSYATSSYSRQCLPNATGPNTSQIYTGAFENSNANVSV